MNDKTNIANTRLNSYCNFMAIATLIPILCTLIGCVSPFLFYFCNTPNIGLESEGYSFFISRSLSVEVNPEQLTFWQAGVATVADTLQIGILVYAFYQLRLLFLSYSHSQYFTVASATLCYNFGRALVIWVILGFIFEPILSPILSYNTENPMVTVSFTSDDLMTLFPALSIMIIGQILKKACQIAEENQQLV
ncbi:DUF2975 domain-containing protein [Orbaceae bacterium ac157xtp]